MGAKQMRHHQLGYWALGWRRRFGERARAAGVELLVTVGARAAWAGETFGGGGEHLHAADAVAAAALLRERLAPGDTVLVKGSRGIALERVAEELAAWHTVTR